MTHQKNGKTLLNRPVWIIDGTLDNVRGVSIDHPADEVPRQIFMNFRIEIVDEQRGHCLLTGESEELDIAVEENHQSVDVALKTAQALFNIHPSEWVDDL